MRLSMNIMLLVTFILAVFLAFCSSATYGHDGVNTSRAKRGFRNMGFSMARGFGKRDEKEANNDFWESAYVASYKNLLKKIQDVETKVPEGKEVMDMLLTELQKGCEFIDKLMNYFVDKNHDGNLTYEEAQELLRALGIYNSY